MKWFLRRARSHFRRVTTFKIPGKVSVPNTMYIINLDLVGLLHICEYTRAACSAFGMDSINVTCITHLS